MVRPHPGGGAKAWGVGGRERPGAKILHPRFGNSPPPRPTRATNEAALAARGPSMPAHRKPTELLQLSGAFEKNPARRRPVGPKSDKPIGDPPTYFAPDEAACWREFVADAPAGVLTGGDQI